MENKGIWRYTAPILQRRIYPELNKQMDKRLYPPFPQEGWPRNSQKLPRYSSYFHSGQYSATQPHWTWNWENSQEEPKWLSKKSIHITNFDNPSNIKRFHVKNLEATLLFVDFSKVFDSIYRGKMEQILLANGLPKETSQP